MTKNTSETRLKNINSKIMAFIKVLYKKKIGITFMLVIIAISSTLLFTGYSQKAYRSTSFWVKHTYEVLDTAVNISYSLIEIQNNNYENILAKTNTSFHLLDSTKQNLLYRVNSLKQLTSDNLKQQPRIDSLLKIIKNIFIFYEIKIINDNENLNILNGIKKENNEITKAYALLGLIKNEEKRLLIIRQKNNDTYINNLNYSFCFLIGGLFILLVMLYFNRQDTQEKVDDFNFKEQDYQTELKVQEQVQINSDKAFSIERAQYNYVMSHDLKEPLRMVIGFMDLLQKGYHKQLDEKANSYIKFAGDGAKRMQKMINDMLRYASIGENNRKLEKISIVALVEEVQLNLINQIEESNTKIIIGLPACSFKAYKAEILRLFQNLLINAIKFRKNNIDSIININCVEHKMYWQVSIKDNGIGIDKFYQDKAFEIFWRLHTDKEYDGTGIGLAICKKIVEQHHGKIWIDSEPGKGCIFYFTISKNL